MEGEGEKQAGLLLGSPANEIVLLKTRQVTFGLG